MGKSSFLLLIPLWGCAWNQGGDGPPGGDPGKADDGSDGTVLLENAGGQNTAFRGVGRLADRMTCTAFLLDNGGGAAAPAYAVSNGHCVEEWAALQSSVAVHGDHPAGGEASVSFDWFVDTSPTRVAVKGIAFSTMKGIDLALLELATTRGDLEGRGIAAMAWAEGAPSEGSPVFVVGAPLFADAHLRRADCRDQGSAAVVERNWSWPAVRRNDCAGIIEGSSGSPVFDQAGRVFAVVNTTTRGQDEAGACYLGAPCEVGAGGFRFVDGAAYAMPLASLRPCFGEDGRFDRARAGCGLDPGRQLDVSDLPFDRNSPLMFDGSPERWGVRLLEANGFTVYREKSGPAGRVRCEDETGYSAPAPLAAQDLAARSLPQEDGPHQICLLGGTGSEAGAAWQEARFATTITTYVDSTPPGARPVLRQLPLDGFDGAVVDPIFRVPEQAGFRYFFGPQASTDCSRADAEWRVYRRFPIDIPAGVMPARFCLKAEDVVGNMGPPHSYEITD